MVRLQARGVHADAGQVATSLVVCAILGALSVLLFFLIPVGGAADQRSRAQTAADAAALAAVGDVGGRFKALLAGGLSTEADLTRWLTCGTGRDAAQVYASRNGADIAAYCYRHSLDRVVVEVKMQDALPNGGRAQARAAATMKLPLGRCRFDRRPPLPPLPPPPSLPPLLPGAPPLPALPPVSPPPLPDLPLVARCGSYELRFLLLGEEGLLSYVGRDLDDLLKPRLVSTRGLDV